MIELTRCGAQAYERVPAVMTAQEETKSYERLVAGGTEREMPEANAMQTGGMAPSAAQGSAMQGMVSSVVRDSSRTDTSLGPLPSTLPGLSSAEELLHSSWKSLMARNVGRSVIVSFLVGTRQTVVAQGILYEVGSDYIALYQPERESYVSADLYSIRFMEFLPEISQTNSQQQRQ